MATPSQSPSMIPSAPHPHSGKVWRGLTRTGWWTLPLLMLMLLLAGRMPELQPAWRLTVARVSACGDADPSAAAQAQTVQLPFQARGSTCRRFEVEVGPLEVQRQPYRLVIGSVGRDAQVALNGVQLRDYDPASHADFRSIPQVIVIPPGVVQAERNTLHIKVRGGNSSLERDFLGSLLLAPAAALDAAVQRSLWLGAWSAQWAVVGALAILFTVLPLAWHQPRDPAWRWLALAVLSSQIYIWNIGWGWRPLPLLVWHALAHGALVAAAWAVYRLAWRQAHPDTPRRWRGGDVLAAIAAGCLLLALLGHTWPILRSVCDASFRLCTLLLLVLLGWTWWRQRHVHPQARWQVGATLLLLSLGLADSLRVWGHQPSPLTPYLLHWGILYVLVLLLVERLRQLLASLQLAEARREDLALALEARTLEVRHELQLRQQAEQARALAEERQRIMRDMHDGVGGQLVALISQAEAGTLHAGQLEAQLRRSLDDLRLMIDSLDEACADLGVALGMLRQRLQHSQRGMPTTLRWDTANLPDLAPCSPEIVLQVLRILQEALTNALRHAQARHIEIRAQWQEGWLQVDVQDDGCGLSQPPRPGRGLPSMQQRAARIGASLQWLAAQPGTCLRLRLPVQQV